MCTHIRDTLLGRWLCEPGCRNYREQLFRNICCQATRFTNDDSRRATSKRARWKTIRLLSSGCLPFRWPAAESVIKYRIRACPLAFIMHTGNLFFISISHCSPDNFLRSSNFNTMYDRVLFIPANCMVKSICSSGFPLLLPAVYQARVYEIPWCARCHEYIPSLSLSLSFSLPLRLHPAPFPLFHYASGFEILPEPMYVRKPVRWSVAFQRSTDAFERFANSTSDWLFLLEHLGLNPEDRKSVAVVRQKVESSNYYNYMDEVEINIL